MTAFLFFWANLLSLFAAGPNETGFSTGEGAQADSVIWGISIACAVLVMVTGLFLFLSASKGDGARKDIERISELLPKEDRQ